MSSVNEHLDWFHIAVMVNSVAVNMDAQVPPWCTDADSFGDIPSSVYLSNT